MHAEESDAERRPAEPFVIERDHEQVCTLKLFQHLLSMLDCGLWIVDCPVR